MPHTSPQHLSWPNCRNVRDLGGLPTHDGHHIRPRALIRADNLDQLTTAGADALHRTGISRIIDLRSADEIGHHPHRYTTAPHCLNRPVIDPAAEATRNPDHEPTLAQRYRSSVIRNAATITAGLAALADAPPGAVLVHCHAGKDRTGIHVALALTAAGVPADAVAADYAATTDRLATHHRDILAATDPAERPHLRDAQTSHPDTILGMLTTLTDRYGTVADYLLTHGMTTTQLHALRTRLRTP